MIRILMVAAAAMTWACAAQPIGPNTGLPAETSQEATDRDLCGMSNWGHLIGQPESAIPTAQLPPGARHLRHLHGHAGFPPRSPEHHADRGWARRLDAVRLNGGGAWRCHARPL